MRPREHENTTDHDQISNLTTNSLLNKTIENSDEAWLTREFTNYEKVVNLIIAENLTIRYLFGAGNCLL